MNWEKAGWCVLAVLLAFFLQSGVVDVAPVEAGILIFDDQQMPESLSLHHDPVQLAYYDRYERHHSFSHAFYAPYYYYYWEKHSDRDDAYYPTPRAVVRDTMDIGMLQKKLNDLGYDCGDANGVKDGQTQSAVESFQRDYNLFEGGMIGLQSKRVIESFDLKSIQTKLKQLGYDCEPDGIRDARTIQAIHDFQNARGLESTGVINKRTKEAIDAKAAPYPSDIVFVNPWPN